VWHRNERVGVFLARRSVQHLVSFVLLYIIETIIYRRKKSIHL
jgi:hypothetical protein